MFAKVKPSLMLIPVFASTICAAAYAATQRNNDVFFAVTGVQGFSFIENEHSIHSGQPWGGVTSDVTHSGAEAHILVKAGRKGSSSVAQWFKNKVAAGQTLVCDSKGNFPDELNFAAAGTLKFSAGGQNITCNDVLIGQGHFATANNWWMGGPRMHGAHASLSGGTMQICQVEGQAQPIAVLFTPQTPCTNHFNIGTVGSK